MMFSNQKSGDIISQWKGKIIEKMAEFRQKSRCERYAIARSEAMI